MSEEISQQELAAIAAARLRRMQRSQQPEAKVESKAPNPAPAKQSKPKAKNNYWNRSKNEDIVKNPRHVADIHTNTPWIPQPQVDDVCAIAERPYNAWIDLEAQHIDTSEDKWAKQNFVRDAYNWPFRSLMRCVAISEDGLLATVSVSGTRKRLPLACLWEMNKCVDIQANSVYDGN